MAQLVHRDLVRTGCRAIQLFVLYLAAHWNELASGPFDFGRDCCNCCCGANEIDSASDNGAPHLPSECRIPRSGDYGGRRLYACRARAPSGAVPVAFPFSEPGVYAVSHGGATALLNYHCGISPELRYAMDMGRLDAAGRRAAGLLPSELSAYSSYGIPVVSPVSGIVLEAIDGVPNSPIGGSNPGQPGGNHVAVHDPTHAIAVWLCHLKPGSVRLHRGDHVHVGELVGEVGNSGSSFEPHLRLCAQRYVAGAYLEGVRLVFDGRFLVRNSTIRLSADHR